MHPQRPFASKQALVQLTQPVLRTALFPALQGSEAALAQAHSAFDQARFDSMQRFVEACFEVLKARDALEFSQAERVSTVEQLAAARRAFTVGTAPIVDVREAEAKADTVAAQLSAAQFDLELRQQILAELVGRPVVGLLNRGLRGDSLPTIDAASVFEWLGWALAQSAQVRQSLRALEVAEAEVRRAEQAHAPTVDLTASYNAYKETASVTTLVPRRADSAQFGFNVNIPLFASGATQARVLEQLAVRDKAQADVEAARRTASLGVRQYFSATLSAVSQANGLEAAVRSNEVALRANRRGYEVGLKVNAEVLNSQTRLFEARRDLSRARYDAWVNFVKLAAQAGTLTDGELNLLESLLVEQPASALQETRRPGGAAR